MNWSTRAIMQSKNFEFLRTTNGELADLAGFAEAYVHTNPSSALVKLRLFGENLVADFFQHYAIPRDPRSGFLDFLRNSTFENSVPPVILNKLHTIRIQGNRAAHGSLDDRHSARPMETLREAFDLGKWYMLTVHGSQEVVQLQFAEPSPGATGATSTARLSEKAAQQIASQEAQMQKLLADLEDTRARAESAEKNEEQMKAILAEANQAANVLQFDEAATRNRLIDQMLVQAGWNVGANGSDTSQVGQEVPVKHQPTESGNGFADYVLWGDDGKPLAVVEAKKTSRSILAGHKQAKDYAEALEKEYGQRPVIFCTNGFEIDIWDDAKGEVPRRIFGFYSKDSLEYCHWRNGEQAKLTELSPDQNIVDRLYQLEAIKRVCETFDARRRKVLIVQATGTGKTRVAMALTELLIRAHWVKRVLFLCDRRELRKQANNTFAQFLDSEPRTYVTNKTKGDRKKTVYLATYPAMMKCFQDYDTGFFDLIIADESHRSIYNRYRDLFVYFDALQVGLTATPIKRIARNTFIMFDCEDGDPTATYTYEEAITDTPPWLAHFQVTKHTTKFLRKGMKYAEMSEEEQRQLDEQVEDAELIDYSKEAMSQDVFNKDTDRAILRNLMNNGLRVASGAHVGKTIIFARNHNHAVSLQTLFNEMYPQYMKPKQEFCAVIDNYIDRAEQLIDDFKGVGNNPNLHIAISVDMLDTGIDVPEIVNLVFAKPVKSYVKFWQMIGRGTRLCQNLFGPGKHKEFFQIFDHWGNFEYFGENPPECEPSTQKALTQQIFETRIRLGESALERQDVPVFDMAVELLTKDVNALPDETIAIREKLREVKTAQQPGYIKPFDAAVVGHLRQTIAPLMQWRVLEGHEDAYRFDLLVARAQNAKLKQSSEFDDHKDQIINQVLELPINLSQVKAKIDWINKVKNAAWWGNATILDIEEMRRELRGIMHCRNKPKVTKAPALHLDITDSEEESEEQIVKLEGLDLAAYRQRVQSVFRDLFGEAPALQKIKAGLPVQQEDLRDLIQKVMLRDPELKVDDLLVHFPNKGQRLDLAIRQVIGLDAEVVNAHFTRFAQKYANLTSHQFRFLELLKRHIATYGTLELERLYEQPFTQIHSEGVDGVFTEDDQVGDLISLIDEINQLAAASAESTQE